MKQQIDFDLERAINAEVRLLHFLCWVLYIFSLHNATGWEWKVPQEGKKRVLKQLGNLPQVSVSTSVEPKLTKFIPLFIPPTNAC